MTRQLTLLIILLLPLYCVTTVHAEAEAEARRLLNALGCKGCHKFEGDGGTLAPVLDQVGSRLSRQEIETLLGAHADSQNRGSMPSYSTTPTTDLQILSEFLYQH